MTKSKTKVGDCTRLVTGLASSLGFNECDSICESEIEDSREAAFASKTSDEFAFWYLKSEVFSKFAAIGSGEELENAAIEKFWKAELACMGASTRLYAPLDSVSQCPREVAAVFNRARNLLAQWFGEFDLTELPQHCNWGPGATTELSRRKATKSNKWEFATHVTPKALPYALAFRAWLGLGRIVDLPELQVVRGNKVTTVPKSYKGNRTIAIEPSWNAFLQKGVGGMIRARLTRLGMLTPDAQSRNRAAAREGSTTGLLSTIDLSMASDSVSTALIELLWPASWSQVLQDLRSPEFLNPDRGWSVSGLPADALADYIPYEKISSMGCGYTFELETATFLALVCAASQRGNADVCRVYGDDIICSTDDAAFVLEVLQYAGFRHNAEKTFVTGPFRESCGGHYWQGHDVTPFYVKSVPSLLSQVIELANKLLLWSGMRQCADLQHLLRGVWQDAFRRVGKPFRGPIGTAGTIWSEWDRATPVFVPDTHSYYVQSCRRRIEVHPEWDRRGALADALYADHLEPEISRPKRFSTQLLGELLRGLEGDDISYSSRLTGLERDVVSPVWIPSSRWPSLPVSWL